MDVKGSDNLKSLRCIMKPKLNVNCMKKGKQDRRIKNQQNSKIYHISFSFSLRNIKSLGMSTICLQNERFYHTGDKLSIWTCLLNQHFSCLLKIARPISVKNPKNQ